MDGATPLAQIFHMASANCLAHLAGSFAEISADEFWPSGLGAIVCHVRAQRCGPRALREMAGDGVAAGLR